MTRTRVAAIAVALVLLIASTALGAAITAHLPNRQIVVNHSIGGISLGENFKKAVGQLGELVDGIPPPAYCVDEGAGYTCAFPAGADGQGILLYSKGSKVSTISISTGEAHNQPVCSAPLDKLKTSKHIGLCSTISAVRKAYKLNSGDIARSGRDSTTFTVTRGHPMRVLSIFITG